MSFHTQINSREWTPCVPERSAELLSTSSREVRAMLNEVALQDFKKLTSLMVGFDVGERLLFNGLVSKAFDTIALRCEDTSDALELACAARSKLFEFLQSYRELRGVRAR